MRQLPSRPAHSQLAYCLHNKPDPDWAGAIDAYGQALALDASPEWQAPTLYWLAYCLHNKPDPDWAGAIDAYRQAEVLEQRLGSVLNQSTILIEMAKLRTRQGSPALAVELYLRALAFKERLGDERGQALVLSLLAALKKEGQYDEALEFYRRSLTIYDRLSDLGGQIAVLHGIASVYRVQGEPEEAEVLLRRAMKLAATELGDAIVLMVGENLIPTFDPEQGGTMLKRIKEIREQLSKEQGFVLPSVRIVDNQHLQSNEYVLFIHGEEILRSRLLTSFAAVKAPRVTQQIEGIESVEPGFVYPLIWISDGQIGETKNSGYEVIPVNNIIYEGLKHTLAANKSSFSIKVEKPKKPV